MKLYCVSKCYMTLPYSSLNDMPKVECVKEKYIFITKRKALKYIGKYDNESFIGMHKVMYMDMNPTDDELEYYYYLEEIELK